MCGGSTETVTVSCVWTAINSFRNLQLQLQLS